MVDFLVRFLDLVFASEIPSGRACVARLAGAAWFGRVCGNAGGGPGDLATSQMSASKVWTNR